MAATTESLKTRLSSFIQSVEDVAADIEVDALKLLKGVVHLAEVGAPIAAIVGGALGQPEVVAGATLAETTSQAVDTAIRTSEASTGADPAPNPAGTAAPELKV